MKNKSLKKPLVRFKFEGSAIHDGKILFDDLFTFISNYSLAIERVTSVLVTGSSLHAGRTPKAFEISSVLEVVAMNKGSFEIALDIRETEQERLPGFNLNIEAIRKLALGINQIKPESPLPDGFDQGVLMALRDAGRILDRGVDKVHIRTKQRTRYKKLSYLPVTKERIMASISRLEQTLVKVEGRLLMADVKENALRCRIHPSSDMPILCSFNESLVPQIMSNLRNFVQVRGEAARDSLTNKIKSLVIYDLEPIKETAGEGVSVLPSSAFWSGKSFEELADEQGIYPVDDIDKITGGFPDDADFDSFLTAIRSSRDN